MENNFQHTIETNRISLSQHQARSSTTIHGGGAALFSIPFIIAGLFIIMVANGVIDAKLNAPRWVVGIIGGVFSGAGLLMCFHGIRGMLRNKNIKMLKVAYPREPWRYDYKWNRDGAKGETGPGIINRIMGLLFISVFLVPFHWWGLYAGGGIFVLTIVGFFDLILLLIAGQIIYKALQKMKYGSSFLRFNNFPFYLGENLEATIESSSIGTIDKLTMLLRCIEEKYEVHGHGKNRKSVVVSYQIYADRIVIDQALEHSMSAIPVYFQLPENSLATDLASRPPRYWEIEIQAETPGIDFQAVYLVPVYKRPE